MIRFEEEDSDPYHHIVIYDGDEAKSGSLVAFSLDQFESWMKAKGYPQTVKEAESLLNEHDVLIKKQADEYHQRLDDELRKERDGTYEQRYERLKQRGYSESKIHAELFPEEYDFMFDDHVDAKLRSQGGNPMSKDYIAKVNARRASGGFTALGSANESDQTNEWCKSQGLLK